MALLDKYTMTSKPPKIVAARGTKDELAKVRKTFIAGVEKQRAQAKAYKPGSKDLRSWVTRDDAKSVSYITVKYGTRLVPLKGNTKSTIGPVPSKNLLAVFDDLKSAAQKGELDHALKKVSTTGPRKKIAAKKKK